MKPGFIIYDNKTLLTTDTSILHYERGKSRNVYRFEYGGVDREHPSSIRLVLLLQELIFFCRNFFYYFGNSSALIDNNEQPISASLLNTKLTSFFLFHFNVPVYFIYIQTFKRLY